MGDGIRNAVLLEAEEPSKSDLSVIENEFDVEEKIDCSNFADNDNLLKKYLNGLKVKKLLSRDEEIELAKRIAIGGADGKKAFRKFVDANLFLVAMVALRHSAKNHLKPLDYIQEGNIGLIIAVQKYDWQKGFKFSTYAIWWIRKSILAAIRDTERTIRLPGNAKDELNGFFKKHHELRARLGRAASVAEIAAWCRMEEVRVIEMLNQAFDVLSLNQKMGDDSDDEIQDLLPDVNTPNPEKTVEAEDFKKHLRKSLKQTLKNLSRNERTVFVNIYLRHLSPKKVAKKMKYSEDRICRIQQKVKKILQMELNKICQ